MHTNGEESSQRKRPDPACKDLTELFFADDIDGRVEKDRAEREMRCEAVCWTCHYRTRCLHMAIIRDEYYGVWGAMGEGERRDFQDFLKEQGIDEPFPIDEHEHFLVWLTRYYQAGPRLRRLA